MTKAHSQLTEIVRLKKQIAENEFRVAQQNLSNHNAEIEAIETRIGKASNMGMTANGIELDSALKYVSKQTSKIQELIGQRGILERNLELARTKLQSAIVSESVLQND